MSHQAKLGLTSYSPQLAYMIATRIFQIQLGNGNQLVLAIAFRILTTFNKSAVPDFHRKLRSAALTRSKSHSCIVSLAPSTLKSTA